MIFNGTVSYRPIRIGFLVPPDDLAQVVRVVQLSTCLWGGRYNPIIPVFEKGGDRWSLPHVSTKGFDVARGFIDFFEPDLLVESVPGVAEQLGWQAGGRSWGLPRILALENFFEVDYRKSAVFTGGIDVLEVIADLYETEFKFERRHQQSFAKIGEAANDAFFDVVVGRLPSDEPLRHIKKSFEDVFSPVSLPPDASTAVRQLKDGLFGPLWVTCHGLEEGFGSGLRDEIFYIFDSWDPGDVIDYWNFRLVEKRVYPINVRWLTEASSFVRDRIAANHRPIPGNPFGTKFRTSVYFGASISHERGIRLASEHLSGLPEDAFYLGRDPQLWHVHSHSRHRRDLKIRVSGPTTSFDVEVKPAASIRIPAPSPPFLNRTGRYLRSRWTNVIVPGKVYGGEAAASVYPTNLWSPGFPRLAMVERFRIGREGWVLQQEHSLDHSLLSLQTGRDAIITWFNTQGIQAKPSEEGQIAAQVITAAGGLSPSGMFADPETLELLGQMAENRADVRV